MDDSVVIPPLSARDKPWLSSYSPGVPAEIDLAPLQSIGAYFEDAAARFFDRQAFVSGATGIGLSYGRLERDSRAVAGYFQSTLGLSPGARVALMMPNILQYPVCMFGLLRAGYVVVNVNPMYTARELEQQLADSGAEAMIVVELFAHSLAKVIARTAVRHVVVAHLTDFLPPLKRPVADFLLHRIRKAVPPYHLPGHVGYREMLTRGARARLEPVHVAPADLAFLQYTGGTTGVSKGAMLTHLNILSNVRQSQVWSEPFLDKEDTLISITAIPMYHIFALGSCLSFLGIGGTNVLVADPRDIAGFVKVLARYRFASLPGVNTLFNALLDSPGFASIDFSALRFAIGGGAAVQQRVAQRWRDVTGTPLVEGYGLTECSPSVCVNPFDAAEFSATVGLPLPSTEISVRDADGSEVAIGQPGELCVRGPQVMKGYWQRPAETAAVMTSDGFLRTGDVATMDQRGYVRIVDRLKDMILVSGFNVYPNEIEDVAAMHAGVQEVAAVGKPDDSTGEAVWLYVVRRDPDLTSVALVAHCRESLTRYKVPKHVVFLDSLPKTNVGKIVRRELRDRV